YLAREPDQIRNRNKNRHSQDGLSADAGNGNMNEGMNDHHTDSRSCNWQMGKRSYKGIDDGVDNLTLIKNNKDCSGKTNQQSGKGHGFKAFDKAFCCPADAKRPDQPCLDSHNEEERRHLIELPPKFKNSINENRKSYKHNCEDNHLPKIKWSGFFLFGNFWLNTGLFSVPHCSYDPDCQRKNHKCQTKFPAGKKRKSSDLLRDCDLKRINRTECRADGRRAQTHSHRRDRLEP